MTEKSDEPVDADGYPMLGVKLDITTRLRAARNTWHDAPALCRALHDAEAAILEHRALFADCLDALQRSEHRWDCPRVVDDYECQCGRDDLIARLEEALK